MIKSIKNKTIKLDENDIEILGKSLKDSYLDFLKLSDSNSLKNILINSDIFEVAKSIPEKIVDLLIVDPPYNLSKKFNENSFSKISDDLYRDFTKKWLESIKHTLKDDATVYVCCDWQSSSVIHNVLNSHFNIRNRITWQRDKGRGASKNWKNSHEDIWYCTVGEDYKFNLDDVKIRRKVIAPYKDSNNPKDWFVINNEKFRDTHPSNFWDDITIPYWSMPENTEHPTQKPEKLLAKLILASSNEGDLVLDPFSGSGSTLVAAKKLNRNYIGIEIDKYYSMVALKRLELSLHNNEIQGYTDKIFWERNTQKYQKFF